MRTNLSTPCISFPAGCLLMLVPNKPNSAFIVGNSLLIEAGAASHRQHLAIMSSIRAMLFDAHKPNAGDINQYTVIDMNSLTISLALMAASHVPEEDVEKYRDDSCKYLAQIIENNWDAAAIDGHTECDSCAPMVDTPTEHKVLIDEQAEKTRRFFKGKLVKHPAAIVFPDGKLLQIDGKFASPSEIVLNNPEPRKEKHFVDAVLQSDRKLRFVGARKNDWIHFSPEDGSQVSIAARAISENSECLVTLKPAVNDKGDEIIVLEEILILD